MWRLWVSAQVRAGGVQKWADGEDRVGVGEAVCGAPAGGGGAAAAGGHLAAAGAPRRVVLQGHPREVLLIWLMW